MAAGGIALSAVVSSAFFATSRPYFSATILTIANEDGTEYIEDYPLPDYVALAKAENYDNDGNYPLEDTRLSAYSDPGCVVVPDDCFGFGWLDKRLGGLRDGVDLGQKTFYSSSPRPFDDSPTDIPLDHPLRAIAKVLHDSSTGSKIRVKCHMLTDWFAIDLLLHHSTR